MFTFGFCEWAWYTHAHKIYHFPYNGSCSTIEFHLWRRQFLWFHRLQMSRSKSISLIEIVNKHVIISGTRISLLFVCFSPNPSRWIALYWTHVYLVVISSSLIHCNTSLRNFWYANWTFSFNLFENSLFGFIYGGVSTCEAIFKPQNCSHMKILSVLYFNMVQFLGFTNLCHRFIAEVIA